MTGFNRVVLMGNLTRDPELKNLNGDKSVANMTVAVSETYRNRDGEDVETVCFVEVEVWGRPGESCAEYLDKGSPVLVEGKLRYEQWEAGNGEKRNKLRVRADSVRFLTRPRSGDKGRRNSNDSKRNAGEAAAMPA